MVAFIAITTPRCLQCKFNFWSRAFRESLVRALRTNFVFRRLQTKARWFASEKIISPRKKATQQMLSTSLISHRKSHPANAHRLKDKKRGKLTNSRSRKPRSRLHILTRFHPPQSRAHSGDWVLDALVPQVLLDPSNFWQNESSPNLNWQSSDSYSDDQTVPRDKALGRVGKKFAIQNILLRPFR